MNADSKIFNLDKAPTGAYFALIVLLISATFLSKFGFAISGDKKIFFSFFLLYAVTFFAFVKGYFIIKVDRLALYLITVGVLAIGQLYNVHKASIASFIILVAVHLPYIFQYKEGIKTEGKELSFFKKIVIIFAFLGIIQFFGQFIFGKDLMFPIDTFVPVSLLMDSYFGLREMSWGSGVYKPTGVFLLEPSFLSKMITIAIIIHLLYFKSFAVLLFLVFSLLITFSGTGLLPLLLIGPLVLLYKRKFVLFTIGVLAVLSAPIWAYFVGLGHTLDRAGEFLSKGSSGYARFIGPSESIQDFQITSGYDHVIFGMGAGTLNDVPEKDYEIATASWAKIIFEYGVLGTLFYVFFLFYCVVTSSKSGYLIATIMMIYWIMGEFLFVPIMHLIILALVIWPNDSEKSYQNKLCSQDQIKSSA